MPIIDASHTRIDVCFTICMECWLSKVSGEGRVRQPSCSIIEFWAPLLQLLLCFLLGWGQHLFRHGFPRSFTLHVRCNLDGLSWFSVSSVQCSCLVLLVVGLDEVQILAVAHQIILIAKDRLCVLTRALLVGRLNECSKFISCFSLPMCGWRSCSWMTLWVSLVIRVFHRQVLPSNFICQFEFGETYLMALSSSLWIGSYLCRQSASETLPNSFVRTVLLANVFLNCSALRLRIYTLKLLTLNKIPLDSLRWRAWRWSITPLTLHLL